MHTAPSKFAAKSGGTGMRTGLKRSLTGWLVCSVAILSACGGGGGGGGGGGSGSGSTGNVQASLQVSPTVVTVNVPLTDPAPTALVQISVQASAAGNFYITGGATHNGIDSVSSTANGSVDNVTLQFKSPQSLGVGTYTDTLTVKGCYDQACTQQVSNSPQSVAVTYTVTAPAPQLNSLMPGSANSGDAAFTLTVTGVYFSPNAIVKWNGGARTTTYVSATQLTAQISAADIASPGQYAVSVSDQTPGVPDSSTIFFTVNGPGISTLTPSLVTAGAPGFTLAVSGFFLTPQTVVLWNGSLRPTTYVSGNQLTALIGASDLASAGTVTVTVANGPNGVPSAGTPFVIAPLPALALNSLSPTKVSAGGGPFVLAVFGNGFTGSSVVTWNGTNLATSYLSTTTLRAPVAATQIANPGTAAIAVVNPPGQGGTSPAVNLTIESPSIDAVSYQVNPAHTGAVSFKSVTFPASSLWSVNVGGAASYALIVGGRVFVTVSVNGNSQLLALDASTGATLWGPIALAGGSANAAYDAGTLFVVSGAPLSSPTLSALDPATGNSKWSSPVSGGSVPAPPVAADGVVYTIDDGLVTALDETSGVTLWNQEVTGTSGTVAVAVDGIYASAPCTTYALQPAIGSTLWTHNTGCEGGGGATPVVANGVLYSPIGVNGYSGTIYDAETGTVQGTFAASYLPALTSTTGFFLTNSTLQGIARSNNQILWSFTGDGALVTSPLVVNNYVIVGSANGNLYALDGATGSQVWTKNLGAPLPMTAPDTSGIYSGLSAGDGLLVVPSGTSVTAYVLSTNP